MSQGWLENFSENLFREIRGKTTELWKVEKHMYTCGGFILIFGKTNTIM